MVLLTQRHFCFFRNNTGLEAQKPAPVFSATPVLGAQRGCVVLYLRLSLEDALVFPLPAPLSFPITPCKSC